MRRRWLRRLSIALAALFVLAGAAWWFVWRPVRPAAALLQRLGGDSPDGRELHAAGVRAFPSSWGDDRRVPLATVAESSGRDAPLVILVAGVTPEGIDDPRVGRLVLALHNAGCAVIAPEIRSLSHPGGGEEPADLVASVWTFATGQESEHASDASTSAYGIRLRRRVAMLGVSLGGGAVLHAIARGRTGDPAPSTVSAVLLVGAPDDVPALAREWFRRPSEPAGASALDRQRASDGCFARHRTLRATIPTLVKSEAEATSLLSWIDQLGEEHAGGAADPFKIESPDGRRWVQSVRAEDSISEPDLLWILAAARRFLDSTSPASIPAAGLARLTMPVFLLHGEADPLIAVTEMTKLAARLSKVTTVRTLPSRLISHVEIESPGLLETWRHLRFVQDFLDVAAAAR